MVIFVLPEIIQNSNILFKLIFIRFFMKFQEYFAFVKTVRISKSLNTSAWEVSIETKPSSAI